MTGIIPLWIWFHDFIERLSNLVYLKKCNNVMLCQKYIANLNCGKNTSTKQNNISKEQRNAISLKVNGTKWFLLDVYENETKRKGHRVTVTGTEQLFEFLEHFVSSIN